MPDLVDPVADIDDHRVADYRNVSDGDLLRRRQLFVAEGRLLVRRLLETSLRVCSVLATPVAHESLADVLAARADSIPVYVAPQAVLNAIAGLNFHRGCLALGERHTTLTPVDLCERAGATRLIILDAIGNSDNVGGIFRNAAAFGADGVLVGPGCCDPLYRKALRTSMGAALTVPFATFVRWNAVIEALRRHRWIVAGLTPAPAALDITTYEADPQRPRRLAITLGSEGDGLSGSARQAADVLLRIPTAPAVDSLNVASAAGIALHSLRPRPAPVTVVVPDVEDYVE